MANQSQNSLVENRLFLAVIGVIVVANLLTANDILSAWNGAEAQSLLAVQRGTELPGLFHWIQKLLYSSLGLDIFALRLPSVLAILVAFAGFWQLGRKLFGKETVITTLVIMSSSILLMVAAKQATADSWLFAFQLINFLFLLLLLKSAEFKWIIGFWLSLLLGALVQPLSMIIWSGAWWAYLYFFHPKGKTLPNNWVWSPLLSAVFLLAYTGMIDWKASTLIFGYGSELSPWKYLFFHLLGCMPWLGFLPAALRDLWYKRRKGEELAIFTSGWLIIGLFSHSLILQSALAFIIAKQVLNCFDKRYPYFLTAKICVAFVLVMSFFGVMLLLTGGFNLFDAPGFRAGIMMGGGYWALYLIGSVGLLMKNRRLLIGGLTFSGLILTAFFWARFGPLMQQRRDLPARIVSTAQDLSSADPTATLVVQQGPLAELPNFKLMAGEAFSSIRSDVPTTELPAILQLQPDALIVTDSVGYGIVKKENPALNAQKLSGSYGFFDDPQPYWIISSRLPKNSETE